MASDFEFDVHQCQEATSSAFPCHDKVTLPYSQAVASRHSRSLSAPVYQPGASGGWAFLQSREVLTPEKTRWSCLLGKGSDGDRRKSQRASLERDVEELEMQLQVEKTVRKALERALNSPCSEPQSSESFNLSPQTKELIKEIASLEVEVVHLEQHVLSLYRKVFDGKTEEEEELRLTPSFSSRPRKSHSFQHRRQSSHGCSSSNSLQHPVSRTPPARTRHASLLVGGNLKPSIEEEPQTQTQETRKFQAANPRVWPSISDVHKTLAPPSTGSVYNSPNALSEQMVRCMASIYCRLADPPLPLLESSPSSNWTCSTANTSSSRDASSSEEWSPSHQQQQLKVSEPHSTMIEVPWIRVDKERLTYAAHALRNFRSMVEQLEQVQPGELKHDEKVCFWINVHNALVMHAYLAYGIPQSHLKRVSLLQKAAYKVGSYSINSHTIEHVIFGCRSHRSSQWLQSLLGTVTKFKTEDRRAYSLSNPEPLVCFALCSGGSSDPAVRLYTPKSLKQDLEAARDDFLLANVNTKGNKVIRLPKLLESHARQAGIPHSKILEWIHRNTPDHKHKHIIHKLSHSRSPSAHLDWTPYDHSFRYVFVRELAR